MGIIYSCQRRIDIWTIHSLIYTHEHRYERTAGRLHFFAGAEGQKIKTHAQTPRKDVDNETVGIVVQIPTKITVYQFDAWLFGWLQVHPHSQTQSSRYGAAAPLHNTSTHNDLNESHKHQPTCFRTRVFLRCGSTVASNVRHGTSLHLWSTLSTPETRISCVGARNGVMC